MARPRGASLNTEIILDLIESVFSKLFLKDLTLAMISKELDIRPPSLYSHFKNLDDLKDQLTARALIKMKEHLEHDLSKNFKKNRLKTFMFSYRDFALENPLLFDSAQFGVRSDNSSLMELASEIVKISLEILNEKGITGEKAIHQIRILRSLLNGFIMIEKQQGFQRSERLDKTFLELIKFTEKGLSNEN